MAIQHVLEKISGSSQSLTLPVFVYDDGTPPAAIDEDDVVAHINGAGDIPTDILGVPDDGDPGMTQLSYSAWRVHIRYRIPSLRALHPPFDGEERPGFNFHLPRRYVKWAPEVGKFWAGAGAAPTQNGFINCEFNGSGRHAMGTWLEPPSPNLTKSLSISPSLVTGSWVRNIASIVSRGYVNSTSLTGGAYAAGEVIITHIIGMQISATLFNIEIGWNWTQNVTGESRAGIAGIGYDGQDYVWELSTPGIERATFSLNTSLKTVYVNQVRPRTDLSAVGIIPP